MPGFPGQVLRRSCRRRSAGGPCSIRTSSAALGRDRLGARRGQRLVRAPSRRPAATSRSKPVSVADHDRVVARRGVQACSGAGARPAAIPARSSASQATRDRSPTGPCARGRRPRSRPGGRSCTWSARARRSRARRPRGRATAPPARSRAPACRRGCVPWGSGARRSSPSPGVSASTSLVTWPCRYSRASGPRQGQVGAVGPLEQRRRPRSGRGGRARPSLVRWSPCVQWYAGVQALGYASAVPLAQDFNRIVDELPRDWTAPRARPADRGRAAATWRRP